MQKKKRKPLTQKHKDKISKGGKGKKRTDQQKLNIANGKIGDKNPAKQQWVRDKISTTVSKNYIDKPEIAESISNSLNKFWKDNSEAREHLANKRIELGKTTDINDRISKTVSENYRDGKVHSTFSKASMPRQYKTTNLHYQASFEFDFLNKYYDKIEIENGKIFKYKDELGKSRRYVSDFYLPKYNLIVEIKSTYTLNKTLKLNQLKAAKAIEEGYNYVFVIDKKYDNLNNILNIFTD